MKILNVFNTIQFLENENIFQKNREPYIVENTKIENASFPQKTTISEANVKTNRMMTKKWTHKKEQSFASNYFVFLIILFQFKNVL